MGAYKHTKSGLAAVLSAALAGCSDSTPEARIGAAIEAMETAVEARDPGAFLEHVAVDFSGDDGRIDRATLRGVIVAQTLRNEAIEVVLTPPAIRLHGTDRATVELSALLAGGSRLPERGRTLSIKSGWKEVDGEWRCYTAVWE